jgi:hypothetical protein
MGHRSFANCFLPHRALWSARVFRRSSSNIRVPLGPSTRVFASIFNIVHSYKEHLFESSSIQVVISDREAL